jgi:hypothetical protein
VQVRTRVFERGVALDAIALVSRDAGELRSEGGVAPGFSWSPGLNESSPSSAGLKPWAVLYGHFMAGSFLTVAAVLARSNRDRHGQEDASSTTGGSLDI